MEAGAFHEACGREDREGGADDDHAAGGGDLGFGLSEMMHLFAEPDDVRPELAAGGAAVAEMDGAGTDGSNASRVVGAARFRQFAVEVDDPGGASALVEVVDVLCDDYDIVALLESGDGAVAVVGLGGGGLGAALVVEVEDEGGVLCPGFGRGDIFNAIAGSEAGGIAEGGEAARGTEARAAQDDDLAGIDVGTAHTGAA